MNAHAIRLAVAVCSLGAALPASAADIRDQLTPDLIYNHCQTAGVGSETEGTFMLPNGRVTGTVLCAETDLVQPKMTASTQHEDDDNHDDDDDNHDDDDDDREEDDRDD